MAIWKIKKLKKKDLPTKKPTKKKSAVEKIAKKKPTVKKPTTNRKPLPQSKYNPLYHPQVVYWMANAGLTDEQIAKEFKIVRKTLHNWRCTYPDFDAAMAQGKIGPNDRVEKSLYQRAVGYSCPEDKIMQYEGKPIVVHTIRHYPPDVVAGIFWLKNRMPEKYKDRHEVDITQPVTIILPNDPRAKKLVKKDKHGDS